jgi:Fis family transcriptional regulator
MNAGLHTLIHQPSETPFSVGQEVHNEPLRECVRHALERYFEKMNGHKMEDIYQMVLNEVEPPMIETVLSHCGGNQTRASQLLGISRSTLRKKLSHYGLGN